jgi:hypothetical protein
MSLQVVVLWLLVEVVFRLASWACLHMSWSRPTNLMLRLRLSHVRV